MLEPAITVIIPNWNRCDLLRRCLDSLLAGRVIPEILVVDNGSNDDSCSVVERDYPGVRLLRLGRNLGFAAGVNRGLAQVETPWIALLNNDTEVDPGWVEAGLQALRTRQEIGFFASRMIVDGDRDRLDSAGDRYGRGGLPTKRGFGGPVTEFLRSEEVLGACAGAAFYRKEVFEKAGLLDEGYYLYLEDVDLSLRAQLHGFRCLYLPDAIVYHIEAASDPARRKGNEPPSGRAFYSDERVYWITRNRWQLMLTYQPVRHCPFLLLGWGKSFAFHLLKAGHTAAFLRGLWAGIRLTGKALTKRKVLREASDASRKRLWELMRQC